MAIYDLLPTYYQVEANNLKALQPGFVVAQMPFKANDELLKGKYNLKNSSSEAVQKMVANGHIVTISKDGLCTPTEGSVLFITYNDPIVTFGARDHYAFYATNLDEEHVRDVQLIPGDEWMSDIDYFAKSEDSGEEYLYPGAANLVGRIVKVDAENDELGQSDDWFGVKELADGTPAFHYVFVK